MNGASSRLKPSANPDGGKSPSNLDCRAQAKLPSYEGKITNSTMNDHRLNGGIKNKNMGKLTESV